MRNFMLKDLDFSDKSLLSLLNELRPKKTQPQANNTPWTSQETSLLHDLAAKYGQNWKLIASHFLNKKAKDCRLHWFQSFAKRVPGFKQERKPKNSDSGGSSTRSFKKECPRSLRIVMPVIDEGQINSLQSSQSIMKQLISRISKASGF